MAYLTIEFTRRITASDDEIREGIFRAEEVFRAAGTTAEAAWMDNMQQVEATGTRSDLWTQADYVATKDMGEGASLAWH